MVLHSVLVSLELELTSTSFILCNIKFATNVLMVCVYKIGIWLTLLILVKLSRM